MRWTYHSIAALVIVTLLSITSLSDAAVIDGQLLGVYYKGRVAQGVSLKTKVVLNGGLYQTQIEGDGTFAFLDVPTGVYMLEVQSPHLVYSRVRVIVHPDESVQALHVSVGGHWSSQRRPLPMPLTLKPQPRPFHYIPPESAKVVGWLGNPMILMSIFSALMLLLMPKIMANLDDNALDTLRSSDHFSCLPSLPHSPHSHHPPHPHFNHHPMSSGMPTLSSKTMYPSSSPYMVDGALDQHPSTFFRSPAILSNIHFSSSAPSEPFFVDVDGLHGETNGSGSSSSSTVKMSTSNNNGYTGQYQPFPYTSHHQQQAPSVPLQSKKHK